MYLTVHRLYSGASYIMSCIIARWIYITVHLHKKRKLTFDSFLVPYSNISTEDTEPLLLLPSDFSFYRGSLIIRYLCGRRAIKCSELLHTEIIPMDITILISEKLSSFICNTLYAQMKQPHASKSAKLVYSRCRT